ncbi:MAG: DNA (cytosine-5-)-methyltransferase [Lachnospiraceae bacterium]|nr:DNA (cytosine-5-)-methyltransferase [Lachnospiraceae bacterium]
MKTRVVELFAGVGGFRIGLNEVKLGKNGKAIEKPNFDFVWANQWEPATKEQEAFQCYKTRFCYSDKNIKEFSNVDIAKVNKKDIPDFDLLTGGFPCQDYSVARSLIHEKGIEGKKGVLWWQIDEILRVKTPSFVLLENVDRLLKSPSKQRGRDFGIMLRCFMNNGYAVEWRVVNAADYGMPQRRRRIYIFAYHSDTKHYNKIKKHSANDIIQKEGIFAKVFPIKSILITGESNVRKYNDLIQVSNEYKFDFENTGFMIDGKITTADFDVKEIKGITLNDILEKDDIDKKWFLSKNQVEKFKYLKGSKRINRTASNGHKYMYSEGTMAFPDNLDMPGRTMLTSEGTVNRSTHVVKDAKTGKKRFLTSIECERLNQFPDNWTDTMNDKKRHFVMGNALVTGIVKKLGKEIRKYLETE